MEEIYRFLRGLQKQYFVIFFQFMQAFLGYFGKKILNARQKLGTGNVYAQKLYYSYI